jgi:hypothetical protein
MAFDERIFKRDDVARRKDTGLAKIVLLFAAVVAKQPAVRGSRAEIDGKIFGPITASILPSI